ncbi:hypothetical protein CGRA01v4_06755 [Colletotrichum graminicola]|nr:hypothetical protein CGRA01v4_06755 [Colletotrichum graminicola]
MTNLPPTVPDCRYGYINFPPINHLDLAKALQTETRRGQATRTDMTAASPHSCIRVAFYEAFPIHVSQPLMPCRNSFRLVDTTDLPNTMPQRPFRPVPPLNGLTELPCLAISQAVRAS